MPLNEEIPVLGFMHSWGILDVCVCVYTSGWAGLSWIFTLWYICEVRKKHRSQKRKEDWCYCELPGRPRWDKDLVKLKWANPQTLLLFKTTKVAQFLSPHFYLCLEFKSSFTYRWLRGGSWRLCRNMRIHRLIRQSWRMWVAWACRFILIL